MAGPLKVSSSAIQSFEQSEKNNPLTLAALRCAAAALDCELVVAIVPKGGRTFADLAAARPRRIRHHTCRTRHTHRFINPSVATLAELNLLERANILEARRWLFAPRRKLVPFYLLDHIFAREVHRRMFRHVWRWAGKIRDSELNPGVPHQEV